jgi:acyl-CoA thioesterase
MDDIESFIENDRFARHNGITITDHRPGYAKATVSLEDRHLNSAGIAHGGLIFALADAAFSVASNSHGNLSLAVNAHISYFKAGLSGVLTAEASEISLNPKLATYSIPVTNAKGEVIAQFEGTVYRKKKTISDV